MSFQPNNHILVLLMLVEIHVGTNLHEGNGAVLEVGCRRSERLEACDTQSSASRQSCASKLWYWHEEVEGNMGYM
jgi:hypothetical protein